METSKNLTTVVGIPYPRGLSSVEVQLATHLRDLLEGLWFLHLFHWAVQEECVLNSADQVAKQNATDHEPIWHEPVQDALRWGLFFRGEVGSAQRFAAMQCNEEREARDVLCRVVVKPHAEFMNALQARPHPYRLATGRLILAVHRRWRLQASLAEPNSGKRFLYCDVLLRSCLYSLGFPGLAMALVPLALLCYDTLHRFCLAHGVDHGQLHRVESGRASISLPRLRRIIEAFPRTRKYGMLRIMFLDEYALYNSLASLPLGTTIARAPERKDLKEKDSEAVGYAPIAVLSHILRGTLAAKGMPQGWLREEQKSDGPKVLDIDTFRDRVLCAHASGDLRYSESAEIVRCDRSYLSRVLRGESAGSVELFGALAWVLGRGRWMIQAEQREPAAETPGILLEVSRPRRQRQ